MKLAIIFIITTLFAACMPVFAGGDHHNNPPETIVNNTYNSYYNQESLASAMALAVPDAYAGTLSTQVGVGFGHGQSDSAVLMIAKRPCWKCPLLKGAIARDNKENLIGVSALWFVGE